MNRKLLEKAGVAAFGNTWQTELSKRLEVSDRSIRKWLKEDFMPDIEEELICILQTRKAEIDDAINELLNSDEELLEAYAFNKESEAVSLLRKYYIEMCGYKVSIPSHESGVFSVLLKDDNQRVRLTVLDNCTIVKDDGRNHYTPYTKEDHEHDVSRLNEILAMTSQDE